MGQQKKCQVLKMDYELKKILLSPPVSNPPAF